jgi:hypothetical protein
LGLKCIDVDINRSGTTTRSLLHEICGLRKQPSTLNQPALNAGGCRSTKSLIQQIALVTQDAPNAHHNIKTKASTPEHALPRVHTAIAMNRV